MRTFDTGATRDSDDTKPDYEGYLSPIVIRRYGEYMTEHRKQADGKMRDSDNWQKGIPLTAYMKSLWRHLMDLWEVHRDPNPEYCNGKSAKDPVEVALCAIIFNASGYLHEYLKANSCHLDTAPCDVVPEDCMSGVVPEDYMSGDVI